MKLNMDNLKPEHRKKNMQAIKSKNTKPEMIIRRLLHTNGFRYSLHKRDLPGKPDLFLRKYNTVLFINGCFWHRHVDCKYSVLPKSNKEYWMNKLDRNVTRDQNNYMKLKNMGFNVVVVWECEIRKYVEAPEFLFDLLKRF